MERYPQVAVGVQQRSRTRRSGQSVEAVLAAQPWEALEPLLLKAGADPLETIPLLRRYAAGVLNWNRSASNLISQHDEPRFVVRHLVESLLPAYWLKDCGAKNWIDFGSGSGLPGLPLAIAGVGEQWCLVESRRVKTLFLSKIIEELDLRNVRIVRDRLENLLEDQAYLASFDGFTARATIPLAPTLELAAAIVKPGGAAFLWKGSRREDEMRKGDWQSKWVLDGLVAIDEGNTNIAKFVRNK